VTEAMINFQLTLNLSKTYCSSWMHVSLGGPIGFIPEYRKSWLMLLLKLSPLFFNGLGILERSQSTGSWQMLAQFSRRVRRKTLVITGLSVSLQCLVKLWRGLFWGLLKSAVIAHSQHGFMRGKSCLTTLISFHDKVTLLVWWGSEVPPTVREDQCRDHLRNLNICKSM